MSQRSLQNHESSQKTDHCTEHEWHREIIKPHAVVHKYQHPHKEREHLEAGKLTELTVILDNIKTYQQECYTIYHHLGNEADIQYALRPEHHKYDSDCQTHHVTRGLVAVFCLCRLTCHLQKDICKEPLSEVCVCLRNHQSPLKWLLLKELQNRSSSPDRKSCTS